MPRVIFEASRFSKFSDEDFQNRGDNYPKSGVPVSIQATHWKGEDTMEFSFKNTSERIAQKWVEKWLRSKNIVWLGKIESNQAGDYRDDWVDVFVTVVS